MIDPDTLAVREAFLAYLEELTGLPRESVELLARGDVRRGQAFAAGYAAGVAACAEELRRVVGQAEPEEGC